MCPISRLWPDSSYRASCKVSDKAAQGPPHSFFWCTLYMCIYVATMTDAELGEHSPPKMGGVNWYMGRTQL